MIITAINVAVAFQTIFHTTGISAMCITPDARASTAPNVALQPIPNPFGCQITKTMVRIKMAPASNIKPSDRAALLPYVMTIIYPASCLSLSMPVGSDASTGTRATRLACWRLTLSICGSSCCARIRSSGERVSAMERLLLIIQPQGECLHAQGRPVNLPLQARAWFPAA